MVLKNKVIHMNLVIPSKIRKGDTVGFISPSAGLAPFAMHRIERAKQLFEKLGYKVKIAKNALKNDGYVSAPIKDRAEDVHEMFLDPEVRLIISTIGGNHSNQLLKYIDWELIKNNPKIFIGYSDNTVLHYALQSQANLATYYGPCVLTQFGEFPRILDYTLEYFNSVVTEEKKLKILKIIPSEFWTEEFLDWFRKADETRARKLEKNTGYEWLAGGKAKGKLLGGSIPSINHLAGTKYWCDPKDKIFFIDIPEGHSPSEGLSIHEVDAYFADLDNMGLFDSINGLIIGRPLYYNSEQVDEFKKIILRYVGQKNYPILYNVNMGHTDPIVTLQYGSLAEIDSDSNLFQVFI